MGYEGDREQKGTEIVSITSAQVVREGFSEEVTFEGKPEG
jgi:hypothetical protein